MQATLVILMIWKMFWWQSFDPAIHVAVPLYSLNAAIDHARSWLQGVDLVSEFPRSQSPCLSI